MVGRLSQANLLCIAPWLLGWLGSCVFGFASAKQSGCKVCPQMGQSRESREISPADSSMRGGGGELGLWLKGFISCPSHPSSSGQELCCIPVLVKSRLLPGSGSWKGLVIRASRDMLEVRAQSMLALGGAVNSTPRPDLHNSPLGVSIPSAVWTQCWKSLCCACSRACV